MLLVGTLLTAVVMEILGRGGYFKNRYRYEVSGSIVVLGVSATWGERKGIAVFNKLANDLPDEFEIFMVGVTSDLKSKIDDRIHVIERTNSTDELRRLYSIADVFLNPTIQDNYPTVNLEAAACNTASYYISNRWQSRKFIYAIMCNKAKRLRGTEKYAAQSKVRRCFKITESLSN